MEDDSNTFAVVELKYDEGKAVIVRRKWILKAKKKYNKTDDEFCYWSNNLEDSPEEMKCEYSKKFTGNPALFKVFVIKLADTLAEAEKCLQGRLKIVSNKFREPGNTDEEIKKMELKRKKLEKKELKTQKEQAYALNMEYLINEVKLQAPSTSSSIPSISKATNNTENNSDSEEEEEEIAEPEPKKTKSNINNDKSKKKKRVKGRKRGQSQDKENQFQALPTSILEKSNSEKEEPLNVNKAQEHATSVVGVTDFQHQSISMPSDLPSLSNIRYPHCELPSTTFGFSLDDLVYSMLEDGTFDIQKENNVSVQPEIAPNQQRSIICDPSPACSLNDSNAVEVPLIHINSINNSSNHLAGVPTNLVDNSEANIIVLNFDELTTKYNDALSEVSELKSENHNLKTELSKANRRNKLLQDYLVDVNERVPELLFEEKNGGRLYRNNVFLSKKQCSVLDKAKSDNEYLNNLLVCVFGREVLKTHTLTGKRSHKNKVATTSEQPTQCHALDKNRVDLIYDIMDARSVANKTTKLTRTEMNAIIGKKISNLTSYAGKSI